MARYQSLFDFIDVAVKSRKYPNNTAHGLRAALKLFEKELNDEERESLENFLQNIEPIYANVVRRNNTSMTASSLATYKSRLMKVVGDYQKYGIDPTKMSNWNPKIVKRSKAESVVRGASAPASNAAVILPGASYPESFSDTHRIELFLRPSAKFTILVPRDINRFEAEALKGILDSLVNSSNPNADGTTQK
mgnify:CR=1 FL=1